MLNRRRCGTALMLMLATLVAPPTLAEEHASPEPPFDNTVRPPATPIDPGFIVIAEDRSNDEAFVVIAEDRSNDTGFIVIAEDESDDTGLIVGRGRIEPPPPPAATPVDHSDRLGPS